MYFEDKYQSHNESLKRFIERFNDTAREIDNRIIMIFNEVENYRDDGKIKDLVTGQEISFDWEKRHTYYKQCGFPFNTFGQFERKIIKQEILLSIQCSENEECFVIAWHKDFKKEEKVKIESVTANGSENNPKRFTKKFKEFRYSEMEQFYKILVKAFDSQKYDSSVF